MSFHMPLQRGFEPHVSQTDIAAHLAIDDPARMNIPVSSNFDPYPSQPVNLPPSQQHSSVQSPYVPDLTPAHLPKIGQTRCYWALLSANLHFIYLDPVLASHLEDQADSLIGKSLLSFVHPDEEASARQDLGNVLESRQLHGSVTRVRYSRLSRVRRQLGHQGPMPAWDDAAKISLDSNYMAVDIVINWAAEGLVLCFIHAVVDLTPSDNDEENKTGWTNWCGTPVMAIDQIQLLCQRLLAYVPQTGKMTRVFQILSNQSDRPLLMSWPPDHGQGQGPMAKDFAKLVEDIPIDTGASAPTDAKTNCIRRFKATQDMASGMGKVESIFIRHGSVIFACHKVNSPSRSTAAAAAVMQQLGYNNGTYVSQSTPSYYDETSYGMSSSAQSASYSNYMASTPQTVVPPQQISSQHYSPQHWSHGTETMASQQPQYNQWSSHSPPPPAMSPTLSSVTMRSGSFPSPQEQGPGEQWSSQPSAYAEQAAAVQHNAQRSATPNFNYPGGGGSDGGTSTSTVGDVVPPPRRRVSPGSTREHYGSGGRNSSNRPCGVLKCSSCKATQSPEWRKGPSGKKELCNACGLRYARSRAKKEGNGVSSQRRRKDKSGAITKQESPLPSPSPMSATFPSLRRSTYDEGPFVSTSSAGSGSGSDVYSAHPILEGITPSPSPPASSMNFVHYAHPHPQQSQHVQTSQTDARHQYAGSSGSFYSVPSPLSNPPVHRSQTQLHSNTSPHSATYSGRLSPMMSADSPIANSPLSTMVPASFERGRDRDRGMPTTSVSGDQRYASGRSMVMSQQ